MEQKFFKLKERMSEKETVDESILFGRMIQGDRNALEFLYKKYYHSLLNYGLRLTQDRELIKDCIHDLFVNLYKNKSISKNYINVQTYLLKALKNNILYKLIGEKKTSDSLDELQFDIPSNEDLFDQIFPPNDQHRELAKNLLKAVKKLSPSQRNILYLRYIKELSHKEIASILNINEQSSMNSIHRAVHKLRCLMEKDGIIIDLYCLIILLKKLFTIIS